MADTLTLAAVTAKIQQLLKRTAVGTMIVRITQAGTAILGVEEFENTSGLKSLVSSRTGVGVYKLAFAGALQIASKKLHLVGAFNHVFDTKAVVIPVSAGTAGVTGYIMIYLSPGTAGNSDGILIKCFNAGLTAAAEFSSMGLTDLDITLKYKK